MTTTLYIAASLDGYIAGLDGDLSWLNTDGDFGFSDFFSTVDGLVMGRTTYEVVRRLGEWPYAEKPTIVVSRSDVAIDTPNTTVSTGELEDVELTLVDKGVENAWLVGGGELVRSFLFQSRLDRLDVFLHPVLLGAGVPLFPNGFPRTRLKLDAAESYESGLVRLTYEVA